LTKQLQRQEENLKFANSNNTSIELENIYLLEYSKNPRVLDVGNFEINSYKVENGVIQTIKYSVEISLNFTQGMIISY
jgi:hypothetical protein